MRKLHLSTAVILLVAAAGAFAAVTTTTVPFAVDSSNQAGWWSPLEVYGGTVYMAFNGPGASAGNHKIQVAKRNSSGVWTLLTATNQNGAVPYFTDDIGHNQPSIARDGQGYLHVFGSMHHQPWVYFRSDTPGQDPIDHAPDMPDQGKNITYPVMQTAADGDVYLIARVGDDANTRRVGKLYRWDDASDTWSIVATFASEYDRTVYPDDIQIDASGDIHILYEWAKYPAVGFRHKLSYLRYTPSTNVWYDSSGAQVSVPRTTATSDVIQDLVSGEAWSNSNSYTGPAVQSAKLSVAGGVKVVYRHRDVEGGVFKVKSAWPSGGAWNRELVYSAGETTAALGITYTGSEKRVYYVKASGTDRAFVAKKNAGSYTHESLTPGKPIERLAVVRYNGTDHLYLMDVPNSTLFYATK